MNLIKTIYRTLFAHPFFERFNRLMMVLGLSGLGVLNYTSARASGERRFLQRWLGRRHEPVCFDVGANCGHYSAMILEVNPGARLHCFEPHPRNFEALKQRIGLAGNATLHNSGCADEPGTLTLFDYADADGSSHASMHREVIERLHGARSVEHRVPVVCLDDYVKEHGIGRIDLLKIDTEGHEFVVLRGATDTLRSGIIACVHIEFNEMNAVSGVFFKQFYDLLSPNYTLYRLLPTSMLEIKRYTPVYHEVFAFQNIVAFRRTGQPGALA